MASFAGIRGTGDWGTDERPKNFREMILWAKPNGAAPLTAFLSKMASESVNDPEFAWWEEKLQAIRLATNVTTAYTSGDTTITLSAAGGGLQLIPGNVVLVEKTETAAYDNEIMVVSSVTSDTVVVFKRGQAGTTAATIPVSSNLTVIGSVFEEGSDGPELTSRNPTKTKNYCQIFKTGVGITNTADKTKARTGDPWTNDKKRKSFDHSVEMEMAFMFGVPYEDTTGTHPKRYTGGLRHFITTNRKIYTTSPTVDDFLNTVYKVFDYNTKSGAGDERLIFAGNGFLNNLNKLARGGENTRITFDGIIKVYGMSLQRWITPQGSFAIKSHPLMNLHARFANSAFIIDPTNIKYRHMRDTDFKDNTQANDADAREGYWLTEAGLEIHHEYTMAYIGNFVI